MRRLVAAVVAVCVAGASYAQDNASPLVFTPRWEAEPSGADYVRLYPREALNQNVSGVAVLCCTPRADRGMACRVGHEWPEGRGFGAASLEAAQRYRLTQTAYEDYQTHSDTQIRIGVMWAAAVVSEETRNRLFSIDRESGFVCANRAVQAQPN
ncbi:MAG: hypothetical protein ACREH4_05400 [Vitreimonas sp.]